MEGGASRSRVGGLVDSWEGGRRDCPSGGQGAKTNPVRVQEDAVARTSRRAFPALVLCFKCLVDQVNPCPFNLVN